jgi:hypothetical protein
MAPEAAKASPVIYPPDFLAGWRRSLFTDDGLAAPSAMLFHDREGFTVLADYKAFVIMKRQAPVP